MSGLPTPDELLDRFDAGCRGDSDIDMRGVLWDILADVVDTMRLALENDGVLSGSALTVYLTVQDYLVNNYGDD